MIFYKHWISDYAKDTAHLSLMEHGAYLLMLQTYYATEKPLPVGKPLYRLLRAVTRAEREAVDFVAREFWTTREAGLSNKRADEEIRKAVHQRTVNRDLGKRGGRPKVAKQITESVSESVIELPTESKANRNPSHSHSQSQSHSQISEKNPTARPKRTAPSTSEWLANFQAIYPRRAGDQGWRKAERAGNARLTEGHAPAELLDGARRYAEFIRASGSEGTEYVKQAATFLGRDKPFLEPWEPPPTKADARYSQNVSVAREWAEKDRSA